MLGQAEIVVRAHVEHVAAIADADMGILRRRNHALALVGAGGANRVEMLQQTLAKVVVHGGLLATALL